MKKTKRHVALLGLCIAVVLGFGTAYAQDSYQYEVGAAYHTSEDDDDLEIRAYGIGAKVHFSPVNTSGHPLAEAAFLERIGDVEVMGALGDIESPLFDGDVSMYDGSATYMKPGSPIAARITFNRMELEPDSPIEGSLTSDSFSIGIGVFLADGLMVGLSYGQEEEDIDVENLPFPPFAVKQTTDYDDLEINAKLVNKLPGGAAYNVEGSLGVRWFDDGATDGSNTIVSLSGDYYFNDRLSLGAGLTINSGDDESEEGKTIGARVTGFFTPRFYVEVGYEEFMVDDDAEGTDEEDMEIMLSWRF